MVRQFYSSTDDVLTAAVIEDRWDSQSLFSEFETFKFFHKEESLPPFNATGFLIWGTPFFESDDYNKGDALYAAQLERKECPVTNTFQMCTQAFVEVYILNSHWEYRMKLGAR